MSYQVISIEFRQLSKAEDIEYRLFCPSIHLGHQIGWPLVENLMIGAKRIAQQPAGHAGCFHSDNKLTVHLTHPRLIASAQIFERRQSQHLNTQWLPGWNPTIGNQAPPQSRSLGEELAPRVDEAIVQVDLALLNKVFYHVPMQCRLIHTPTFRISPAQRNVNRTLDLLII